MCEREATSVGEPHEACLEPPTEPATYKHQPLSRSLDEIRLLKLRKEKNGPVHCDVEVFSLEQAPEYIALSYRWGPPSPSHDIFIADQRLEIRDILYACLLELREDVDTWLWIDQICIAQADTAERNHQVGMMSRIYSDATSVIVWLGDIPIASPEEVDRFNDKDLRSEDVVSLLENIYFTRLWIVQEILVARRIKIRINGNRCVTWNCLHLKGLPASPIWDLYVEPAAKYLLKISHGYHRSGQDQSMPLMDCIQKFRDSKCQDPRDKVYGFMGVVRVEDRIAVDYNKTVLGVFLDFINVVVNELTVSSSSTTLVCGYIYGLGLQMGIEEFLLKRLNPLLEDRLKCQTRNSARCRSQESKSCAKV